MQVQSCLENRDALTGMKNLIEPNYFIRPITVNKSLIGSLFTTLDPSLLNFKCYMYVCRKRMKLSSKAIFNLFHCDQFLVMFPFLI